MPRRTRAAQRAPTTGSRSVSGNKRSANARSRGRRTHEVSAKRWRRDVRPQEVLKAVAATTSLRWSSTLIEALLEEMYVGDSLEELLGCSAGALLMRRYPQAIAIGLILRHSWSPDDLSWILERLGLHSPSNDMTEPMR